VSLGALLEVRGLSRQFGGLSAVEDLDLRVAGGRLAGLIGPNGAGKTTVFNMLSGSLRPSSGSVLWRGRQIAGLKASRINRLGIARTFQNIRLFGELSVLENVLVGFHGRLKANFLSAILRLPGYVTEERGMHKRAAELLELVGLSGLAGETAGNMALATAPELLLLDEPAAGMNPQETAALAALVRRLRDELGLTVLLIEHDMQFVMNLCEELIVLDHGRVIARGDPQSVQHDPAVMEAYLGAGLESLEGEADHA
jgi:branched-chain amino acid transport system ATP-binding protein